MEIRLGTSGFSYPTWRGSFYPEDLPEKRMLAFYAERLGAVEINNSFYRMPSARVLTAWRAEVPAGFRFVMKASRRITHFARLKEAGELAAYFFSQVAALGEQLGPVLFQLPPNLKKDLPRLTDFLGTLPTERRAAFEFRHASWFDEEVFSALRGAGAALCVAEDEELATPLAATAGWGYVRLRRQDYDDAALARWAADLKAQPWKDAFVFFKHEEAGTGPKLAAKFREILG